MLLFALPALAGALTDDFSSDNGTFSGGTVADGVLRLQDGSATLPALDPATTASFTLSVRVRAVDAGSWGLGPEGAALSGSAEGAGGLALGLTQLPLPMSHLRWVPDADPVLEPGTDYWEANSVLHAEIFEHGGTWYLYYTGEMAPGYGYRQIGVATSTDGETFTRYGKNPLITINYSRDDVDGIHAHMPTVVRSGELWTMIWSCYQNNVGNRLCRATSPDGLTWTKQGVAVDRGAEGEFDSGSLRMPDLWIGPDGTWHLWYDGTRPDEHYGGTGYATSTDGGVTWTKHGEILPFEDALQGLSVVQSPWGLEAFYNKDDFFKHAHASLEDPATWTPTEGAILTKGWASWNDGYIQAPTVWLDGAVYRMWFNGYTYSDAKERLGSARTEAVPGGWLALTLTWDGSALRATVDGAPLELALGSLAGPITLSAEGAVELDDLSVEWTEIPEDSPPPDSGDSADSPPPEDSEAPGDSPEDAPTPPAAEPTCGCGSPGPALLLGLGAVALTRRRRTTLLS